jgi:predicted nuclease of predicted toxin-antitoxin system
LGNADDESIWNYAATHQLVIITKDEDFANRIAQTSHGPAVVWLRLGNCSNRLLLEQLMPMVEDIVERIRLGDQLIEVS